MKQSYAEIHKFYEGMASAYQGIDDEGHDTDWDADVNPEEHESERGDVVKALWKNIGDKLTSLGIYEGNIENLSMTTLAKALNLCYGGKYDSAAYVIDGAVMSDNPETAEYNESKETTMQKKPLKEAFEGQDETQFPYPVDTEDKQGEMEFWEDGYATADAIEQAADMMADGMGDYGLQILGVGMNALADGKNPIEAVQLECEEFLESMTEDMDMFVKRSSPQEIRKALYYLLDRAKKTINEEFK